MTREIKFRFWDNGCMIYPNYWGCGNMGWFYGLPWEDDTYVDIAMQYTGLKDKNGKEIYEGDVIKYSYSNYTDKKQIYNEIIGPVQWGYYSDGGEYCDRIETWVAGDCYLSDVEHQTTRFYKAIEVIGNIYENPELL